MKKKKRYGKEINFYGHKITDKGILPDEKKVEAIKNMKTPQDVTAVKRFCGLTQYMARFLPSLSETIEPIRALTRKGVDFEWSEQCEQAFCKIKKQISEAPVLRYYDPDKELVLQTDSSQSGLGAVLLQEGQPIEYASRSLTTSERNWAQIEKESLSLLFGLERFNQYTYGRKIVIQNDHRPLQNILAKPLSQAPKRLQDIIMKLYRYDITFTFVKGSDLIIADLLSRDVESENETRPMILNVRAFEEFPDDRITEVFEATENSSEMQKLIETIQNGWPQKDKVDPELRKYVAICDTLSVEKGIVLKGEAIYIPESLRSQMLKRLHAAHLGYESMLRRARDKIFWIGMKQQIKQLAKTCEVCEKKKSKNQKQPLKQHHDGKHPWDKVGTDLFQIEDKTYLMVIDYYTNYIELDLLKKTTSKQVIKKLKKQFSRFGIPRELISDGGPQYSSTEFKEFTKSWKIKHHITSPNHPKSNGKAEAGVKIVKGMMKKCLETKTDPYEALLELRNTPRADTKKSPHEMLFSRPARTNLPSREQTQVISERRLKRKEQVCRSYNKTARTLPDLKPDSNVYFEHKNKWTPGRVIDKRSDRNYQVISKDNTSYNRNRDHIRPTDVNIHIRDQSPPPIVHEPILEHEQTTENEHMIESEAANQSKSYNLRPRRELKKPVYLKDYVKS